MWQYNYTDELYHYGIPGQRWGVRRYLNKLKDNITNRRRKKQPNIRKYNGPQLTDNKVNLNKKKIYYKNATNEQLIRATNRINLETNYQNAIYNRKMSYAKNHPVKERLGKKIIDKFIDHATDYASRKIIDNAQKAGENKLAEWGFIKVDNKNNKSNKK